jgi:hypothetical protein
MVERKSRNRKTKKFNKQYKKTKGLRKRNLVRRRRKSQKRKLIGRTRKLRGGDRNMPLDKLFYKPTGPYKKKDLEDFYRIIPIKRKDGTNEWTKTGSRNPNDKRSYYLMSVLPKNTSQETEDYKLKSEISNKEHFILFNTYLGSEEIYKFYLLNNSNPYEILNSFSSSITPSIVFVSRAVYVIGCLNAYYNNCDDSVCNQETHEECDQEQA